MFFPMKGSLFRGLLFFRKLYMLAWSDSMKLTSLISWKNVAHIYVHSPLLLMTLR